jgi:transcriptional regulator with XRE-family HTH domain
MHIGERIKAQRVKLGWSQRDLAERMGYKNHSVIARIEAGKVDINQTRLDQFASVLGLSHGYLLGLVSAEESSMNDQLAKIIIKMRTHFIFI